MKQLLGLKPLYADMRDHHAERVVFSYQNNKATLEVIFIIDETPFKLLIAARGITHCAFEVEVHNGFRVATYLGGEYGPLLDALGVEPNPANPFSPNEFFADLDRQIPSSCAGTSRPRPDQIARYRPDVEEPEKVFFFGWIAHRDRHVTNENLRKTRQWLGDAAYQHCERLNISSRWTDERHEAKPFTPPPL